MKAILCPTDFSKCAENATKYAAKMAAKMECQVLLLHALHVPVVDAYTPPNTMVNMMEDVKKIAENKITNLAEEISKDHGVSVRTLTTFGLATDLVKEVEKKEEIALIVMGTKGAGNALDVMLGTTAAQIMSHSASPSLIIPANGEFDGLKHVGYATDFSYDADKSIQDFQQLMRPFGSQISVVHVTSNSPNLDQIAKIVSHLDHPTKPQSVKGENISEELNAFIWDNNLSLLAMKRHKRNWLNNLFHRSVTKQMVYHSQTPILIFN